MLKSFSGTPAPLADWHVEQASRENIGHGDALSPSVVLTTCIVSAGELVLVSVDQRETSALS